MSESKPNQGLIAWHDITVDDAGTLGEFYQGVVGWKIEPVSMGDYEDFNMVAPGSGESVAGVCHRRGPNAELPPQWLMYITVESADNSAKKVIDLGGKIISGPKDMEGYGRYCVIEDPAGAVCALFEPK